MVEDQEEEEHLQDDLELPPQTGRSGRMPTSPSTRRACPPSARSALTTRGRDISQRVKRRLCRVAQGKAEEEEAPAVLEARGPVLAAAATTAEADRAVVVHCSLFDRIVSSLLAS